MNLFAAPASAHDDPSHPENAKRIPAILAALEADTALNALVTRGPPPPPASDDQIAAVHDRNYIAALRDVMQRAPAYIDHAPTYVTPQSFDCAALAVGAALAAVHAAIQTRQPTLA
ncbi:MAG TPA: hypothetical protein VI547_08375, partial [Anaerolineales bacterium]|nr:hypothetical protein [Anaerolineales bacterium]